MLYLQLFFDIFVIFIKYTSHWSSKNSAIYQNYDALANTKSESYGYSVYRHFQQYVSYIMQSVLFVEKTGLLGENHRPAVAKLQTHFIT